MNRSGTRKQFAFDGASIVLPFVIVSIALGILAWRSYQLSVRMEEGMNTLAIQYLSYAGEVAARRSEGAVHAAISQASEDLKRIEQTTGQPSFPSLQRWVDAHPWIVSAIYVPDGDPTSAVYVGRVVEGARSKNEWVTSEFYTASGTIRYTYDPSRLLQPVIRKQPMVYTSRLPASWELQRTSELTLVSSSGPTGLVRSADGLSVTVPLGSPLERYAVRASQRHTYVGSGWENPRLISLLFVGFAIVLVAVGATIAIRGLRRESETMQLRSALIANISHELRTPLSMIRLGAETLKRSSKLTPAERSGLEESILREVIHLSHLVENVLDIARLQKSSKPLVFSAVSPSELLMSVTTTYESWIRSKGFNLELDLDGNVGEQLWDRESISRAVLNLLDNAIKYSSDDKTIRLTLAGRPDEVEIAVQDRGVGIRSQDLARIFEPYFRSQFSDTESRRGAGLGLTLVRQIAESHGGRVVVESSPGQGSTFRMILPKRSPVAESTREWVTNEGRA